MASQYGPQDAASEAVPGTQAVARAFRVLRAVARSRAAGISLAQVTRETQLNKATAHRLLLALIAEGMIEQDRQSLRYFVGPECQVLGSIANERFGLGRATGDAVARLAHACGDSAFFSVRSDVFAVCVSRADGDFPLKTHVLMPGTRHPLGVGAGSLAMLAALDDEDIERCLNANRALLDSTYPTFAPDTLRAAVAQTRARGYSVNEGGVVAGSWGVGVAVHSPQGEVVGALSIAAVESRLPAARQVELGKQLQDEAQRLETRLREAAAVRAEPTPRKR
ncbi:IclR family transcriptional regulator [Chitinasiproducens palmae]|uniref:DNA-binding transcriptional regulator, IclR family n=1 Tax=Chitinasiproducens palmae TaxID=1770053 RepID=A0A1H2PWT9_9BURK|nr:IclR family transcriptional regulator [Chitinasiproducens palmae]SDV51518.1 DNA-binding transcriptional regulator, IclR family [Chitinasiproducens palmae]